MIVEVTYLLEFTTNVLVPDNPTEEQIKQLCLTANGPRGQADSDSFELLEVFNPKTERVI